MNYKQKKEYKKTIKLLENAFVCNIRAKENFWEIREDFYLQKEQNYKKAVQKIQKYKLPIKWGVNNSIVYFWTWSKQMSFHFFHNWWKKQYNEKRKGEVNYRFPL